MGSSEPLKFWENLHCIWNLLILLDLILFDLAGPILEASYYLPWPLPDTSWFNASYRCAH